MCDIAKAFFKKASENKTNVYFSSPGKIEWFIVDFTVNSNINQRISFNIPIWVSSIVQMCHNNVVPFYHTFF